MLLSFCTRPSVQRLKLLDALHFLHALRFVLGHHGLDAFRNAQIASPFGQEGCDSYLVRSVHHAGKGSAHRFA